MVEIACDQVCYGSRRHFQRLQVNDLPGREGSVAFAQEYEYLASVVAVIAGGSDIGNAVAIEVADRSVNPRAARPHLEGFVVEKQTLEGLCHNLIQHRRGAAQVGAVAAVGGSDGM